MDVDTPAVRALRRHLLHFARGSVPPSVGVQRASARTPEEAAVLARFAPFAELLFLVASIDGATVESEREVILGAFRVLTGGRVRGARLAELEQRLRARIGSSDVEELLEDVASALARDRQDAELGFALAAAVVLADGTVEAEEEAFLYRLALWLGIDTERAQSLLAGERAHTESQGGDTSSR